MFTASVKEKYQTFDAEEDDRDDEDKAELMSSTEARGS